jgi:ribulose-bisphosphate carboxylase large chain
MPAFSSGQWAGTLPSAVKAAQGADFMFMCGGGILAHPDGPAAGVASLGEAWAALSAGEDLASSTRPALAAAFGFFGAR